MRTAPTRSNLAGRLVLVAALGAAVAGCLPVHSSAELIPLRDGRPNPEPVAGYRVVCETRPSPADIFFANYWSGCQQVIEPARRKVVVRAKG